MKKVLMAGGGGGNGVPVRNGLVAEYKFDECRNLIKYSQQFDNAAWDKTSGAYTVTANAATAPDGTTTADRVVCSTQYRSLYQSFSVQASTVYTVSWYIKNNGGETTPYYYLYDNTNAAQIAHVEYTITNDWERKSVTFTTPAGCVSLLFAPINLPTAATTQDAYMWGAQAEAGSTARTYIPTTDKQWLMDYSKTSKNLLPSYQAYCGENAAMGGWSGNNTGCTVTASTDQVYSGTHSLKCVCPGVATTEGFITNAPYLYGLTPGATYTASVWVYAPLDATMQMSLQGRNDAGTGINSSNTNYTGTGAWQLVTGSITIPSSCVGMSIKMIQATTPQAITFYIDHAQIELGASATDWVAPVDSGVLGGTISSSSGDPTWTSEGAYFVTDDYILVSSKYLQLQNYTIIAVVKPNSGDTDGMILSTCTSNSSGAGNTGFAFYQASLSSGKWTIFQFDAGGSTRATTGTDGGVGTSWQMISAACDNVYVYLSKNAADWTTNSSALSGGAAVTTTLFGYIGRYAYVAAPFFGGSIAYLLVYNRKLTKGELAKNYTFLKSYLLRNRGIALP